MVELKLFDGIVRNWDLGGGLGFPLLWGIVGFGEICCGLGRRGGLVGDCVVDVDGWWLQTRDGVGAAAVVHLPPEDGMSLDQSGRIPVVLVKVPDFVGPLGSWMVLEARDWDLVLLFVEFHIV